MSDFDVVVVGAGFGGSLLAAISKRIGYRVALVERGRHPRFAIGESTSPLANIILEQLSARYELPGVAPLASYGSWLAAYPDVQRGLKRGFTFYAQTSGASFTPRVDRSNELLVTASPNDVVSDTHWLRSDVDAFLVEEAVRAGVEYVDETDLDRIDIPGGGRAASLAGSRKGRAFRITGGFVVDATGPNGSVSRALGIGRTAFDSFRATHTVFSHFSGVARCADMPEYGHGGLRPPYPVDSAAVHHVFDGGWMWQLRFDNGVTSAGFMVDEVLAREIDWTDASGAWRCLLARFPSIAMQFESAEAIRPIEVTRGLPFRRERAAGDGWALLPSAAGFVDPLFSTGIPLTLLGVERLAARLSEESAPSLGDYEATTLAELDHTARYVATSYAAFSRFSSFAAWSMFYFAAASFGELARRVGGARRGGRFLGLDEESVTRAMAVVGSAIRDGREMAPATVLADVATGIEAINVAGLAQAAKANWYGVDLEDAVAGAWKIGASPGEVRRALEPFMGLAR